MRVSAIFHELGHLLFLGDGQLPNERGIVRNGQPRFFLLRIVCPMSFFMCFQNCVVSVAFLGEAL